jgi:hypothetical protein
MVPTGPWVMRQIALHPLMYVGYLLHWWKAEEGYQVNESRNRPTAKALMRGWRDETKPFQAKWLAPAAANHWSVPTGYRGAPVPVKWVTHVSGTIITHGVIM